MAQKLIGAVVALLAVLLTGCAVQQPAPEGVVGNRIELRPAQPAVASPVQIPAPVVMLGAERFPTSKAKPQGKPWSTMHEEGFTGDYKVAGKLLGLTYQQTLMYEEMHERGTCKVMDVPNGVVLDRLTFTRGGKHQVDYRPLVNLQNPPTRKTEVCELGGGVVAMRFHGCNNHGVVYGVKPAPRMAPPAPKVVQAPPPASVKPVTCDSPAFVRLNVWQATALQIPGVQEAIAAARGNAGYFAPQDLSRGMGAKLREAHAQGRLGKSTQPHQVTVSIMEQGGEKVIFQGAVIGSHQFAFPRDFNEGEVMRVVFSDLSKLHSPVSDLRANYAEYVRAGCGSVTNVHAVENNQPVTAMSAIEPKGIQENWKPTGKVVYMPWEN